jgi:L-seryl-tRNA(Ser) seleniumtransferase
MEARKHIPPVHEILRSPHLTEYKNFVAEPFAARILNAILSEVRRELAQGRAESRDQLTSRIAAEFRRRLSDVLRPSLVRVINGSGVILHTNLGRAPLPETAMARIREVALGYSNLEFDVASGSRGKRDFHIERLLRPLLECEAALVVNNNAAAVLLVLNTLAEGGEVIISRGEEVEIGDSFRIPEVMSSSGAVLKEVGTTNRTRVEDYEKAMSPNTRMLLRVHPSNFRIVGFTERPALRDLVTLGRRRGIPTVEDLGSGCLFHATPEDQEPAVVDSIRADVDVVCFSGDKLLGGPQAGIIVGKKLFVERMRRNPLYRALRVDKLTISVLESVLLAHLEGRDELPVWRMLHASEGALQARVDAFVRKAGPAVTPLRLPSLAGAGSAPQTSYPSWGVAIVPDGISEAELERRLRNATPPVIARIEDSRVLLDFRTIMPKEEDELLEILKRIQCRSSK